MESRRPTVKKGAKKTFGARTVKRMVLERRGGYKGRAKRPMREMRAKRGGR